MILSGRKPGNVELAFAKYTWPHLCSGRGSLELMLFMGSRFP